jgi:hypothetical protein
MRIQSLAGKPIEQHSSPNQGGTMSDHRGVVLHIAEGTYQGTINWQMNPDQRYSDGTTVTTCSTWIVGREPGEWAQMVDSNRIAWCQRDGSRTWLSIELAGNSTQSPTAWQIEACAQLFVWSHLEYGHALAIADNESERGLGHHSMDREYLGVEWGHDSCPGPGTIAAKPAILQRAKAIIQGDDMPLDQTDLNNIRAVVDIALTSKFDSATAIALEKARPWQYNGGGLPGFLPAGTGTLLYFSDLCNKVNTLLPEILAKVTDDDAEAEQIIATVNADMATLQAAVANVDEEVIAKLGDAGMTVAEKADLLRAVLGDDAAAVGALLAAG